MKYLYTGDIFLLTKPVFTKANLDIQKMTLSVTENGILKVSRKISTADI